MRIGCGAGFAGDRFEPAIDLAERGALDALVLECLAERTIALGQQRKLHDPAAGYDPRLHDRFERLVPTAIERGVRILTNMGAANPLAAGAATRALLDNSGLHGRIAVVTGDDVLDRIDVDAPATETGRPLREHGPIVSANAYLGVDALLPALDTGADVVLTGRVADPSLFLAPLAHRMGWEPHEWSRMAAGTLVGHVLECAGQVTGGYFADPGVKDVPDLAHLGFPFADVDQDGSAAIGKLPGTGGEVSTATVREQLLYEVTDPTSYRTPDVELDFRAVTATQVGPDRVRITGAHGRARPDSLKVSIGYRAGWRASGEISYAGPNAQRRAELAAEILRIRLPEQNPRIDVLGGTESRVRVAALTTDRPPAEQVCHEIEALYTNGPAGGGGVRTEVRDNIGIVSTLLPRSDVEPAVTLLEAGDAAP